MKFVFLGDTHFGCRNANQHLQGLFEKFYSETFFPYLLKNDIKLVIQLGDIFDSRKYSNHNALHEAKKMFFSKFEEYDIKLITLLGNHDIAFKESLSVSSSDLFLSQFENVEVIKEPSRILKDGVSIDIIPWICKENYEECVKFIKQSSSEMCVGHFEIQGFKMYQGGISSEHGLSEKTFSNYDRVLSGHYHHRSKKGNIEYIGTPYEMTWQDFGDQKGFHLFDTETRKLQFIKNPFSIYVKVDYDDTGVETTNSSYLDKEYLEQFKSKYVKIQVKEKTNPYLYDLFIDQVYAQNPIDVSAIEEIVDTEVEDSIDETDDTLTITYKYIDGINQQDLDKVKLKNIMNSLYNDALAVE